MPRTDYATIKDEIEQNITMSAISHNLDYLFFVKRADTASDCLVAFVKANNIPGRIIDIDTDDGFMAASEMGIAEHNVPCVYSTTQQYMVYRGCPEDMEDLRS